MLVQTLDDWFRLVTRSARRSASASPWTSGTAAASSQARYPTASQSGPDLVNVQVDDMRRGVHEHLEFGAGEIDFPATLRALADSGYRGLVAVELPRHAHADLWWPANRGFPDRRRNEGDPR